MHAGLVWILCTLLLADFVFAVTGVFASSITKLSLNILPFFQTVFEKNDFRISCRHQKATKLDHHHDG